MKTLNAYNIIWIALVPKQGKPTIADNKAISKKLGYKAISYFSNAGKALLAHTPSKERAKEIIKIIKGSLSKEYKVYMFTDKQFGLSSKEDKNLDLYTNGLGVKLTSLQISESFYIK